MASMTFIVREEEPMPGFRMQRKGLKGASLLKRACCSSEASEIPRSSSGFRGRLNIPTNTRPQTHIVHLDKIKLKEHRAKQSVYSSGREPLVYNHM